MQLVINWINNNLSLGRIVRFGLSIWVAFEAWRTNEPLLGILAGILMIQVVTNSGCGLSGCQTRPTTNSNKEEEIEFTEIQSNSKQP